MYQCALKRGDFYTATLTKEDLTIRGILMLCIYSIKNGDSSVGVEYAKRYVELRSKTHNESDIDYLVALAYLGRRYIENSDYSNAREIYYKIVDICQQNGINAYSIHNFNKFVYYNTVNMGLNLPARSLTEAEEELLEIEQELGIYSTTYYDAAKTLISLYYFSKDYIKGLRLIERLENLHSIISDNSFEEYFNIDVANDTIQLVCDKIHFEYKLNPSPQFANEIVSKLENLFRENITSFESITGRGNIQTLLRGISLYSYRANDFDKWLWAINQELELFKYDKYSSEYFSLLEDRIQCNALVTRVESNFNELQNDLLEYIQLYRQKLIASLAVMSDEERNSIWAYEGKSFKGNIFSPMIYNPSEEYVSEIYNALLLMKGIQLQATRDIDNALLSNPKLREDYNSLLESQKSLSDESKGEFYLREKALLHKIISTSTIGQFLNIGWNDIQSKLKSNEVAVEFFHKDYGVNQFYGALVLRNSGIPQFIKLDADFSSTQSIYTSIWMPIISHLPNVNTIYFSPDGELYFKPIEYAQNVSGQSLYDQGFNIYRLSSTRELLTVSQYSPNNEIVLYGGLKYSRPNSGERDFERNSNISIIKDNLTQSQTRGNLNYLPGTLMEVYAIDSLMNVSSMKLKSTILTDSLGTKESFLSYNHNSPRYFHIATHGFYFSPKEVRRMSSATIGGLSRLGEISNEDAGLAYSGLLMSMTKKSNNLIDHGILTSAEIAHLDLGKTDFVVLSACQTGLGELTADGVFGLQRGFKKAGVNSMMLSLWKVDDEATQIFMTKFYERFLQGESKHQSLIYAQNYLKNFSKTITENGVESEIHPYSDPKYWSAFILLDANE